MDNREVKKLTKLSPFKVIKKLWQFEAKIREIKYHIVQKTPHRIRTQGREKSILEECKSCLQIMLSEKMVVNWRYSVHCVNLAVENIRLNDKERKKFSYFIISSNVLLQ